MFYSKSTGGFYVREIHKDAMPSDVVEISHDTHAALIFGQSQGKVIVPDGNGYPILQERPQPTVSQLLEITEANRRAAYIAEADPLFFKAQRGEATLQEWQAKVAEIKARFPWSVEWPMKPE